MAMVIWVQHRGRRVIMVIVVVFVL